MALKAQIIARARIRGNVSPARDVETHPYLPRRYRANAFFPPHSSTNHIHAQGKALMSSREVFCM